MFANVSVESLAMGLTLDPFNDPRVGRYVVALCMPDVCVDEIDESVIVRNPVGTLAAKDSSCNCGHSPTEVFIVRQRLLSKLGNGLDLTVSLDPTHSIANSRGQTNIRPTPHPGPQVLSSGTSHLNRCNYFGNVLV